jgi:hypothetical protein
MPGGDVPYLLAGATLVIMAVFFVIVRIITRLIIVLKKRTDSAPVFTGWCTWVLCIGVIFVIVLVGALGVPFRVAFAVSRPKLEQLVEASNGGRTPKGDFWAGLFPFSSAVPIDDGLQFTLRKSEIPWGERGFYFSASGERIEHSHFYDQKSIGSKWFSWHYGGW